MKIFNEFKIENQEFIFGGELIPTCPDGKPKDLYDTKYRRLIWAED